MAAGSTYTPIATTTLGSSASSYTFSSISGSYTDLVLIISAKNSTYNGSSGELRFNSDTGSNYSYTELAGVSATPSSSRTSNSTSVQCFRTDINNFGISIINVQNYSGTNTYKTVISKANLENSVRTFAGLWRSTSAITSITILPEGGTTFSSGCTFTLYGIAVA
jgi:hypothetical protein